VPDHVVHIMNMVTSIDAHHIDIDVVFKLFNVSMQMEDVIDISNESIADTSMGALLAEESGFYSPMEAPHTASGPVDFLTPRKAELQGGVEVEGIENSMSREALDRVFWSAQSLASNNADESMLSDDVFIAGDILKAGETTSFLIRDPAQLKKFLGWKRRRLTAAEKYIAFEQDRIRTFKNGVVFNARCSRRLWTKVKRKLESEVLELMAFESSWKLGTDEGSFPGRERVVLRRKYTSTEDHTGSGVRGLVDSLSVEKINEVLVNYIKRPSVADNASPEPDTPSPIENEEDAADDDEDEKADPLLNLDENDDFQNGNRLITGPCHSGARRSNFGVVKDEAEVTLITPSGNYLGKMAFSKKDISFISSSSLMSDDDSGVIVVDAKKKSTRRRWTVSAISQVFLRRYRLRDTALEVFFRRGKHRNFFIDFGPRPEDAVRRNEFGRHLMRICPKSTFRQWPSMSPYRIVNEIGVLNQWQQGEISNFEYLMVLSFIILFVLTLEILQNMFRHSIHVQVGPIMTYANTPSCRGSSPTTPQIQSICLVPRCIGI
jgi:hypothetical protein